MKLLLLRHSHGDNSTGGLLFIDGEFLCYTCEDEAREVKVQGETCIPVGRYDIKLRTDGGMANRYAGRFDFHRGMLWLQDVPGFTYIYVHVGNNEAHTAGCILVGLGARLDEENTVQSSTDAYTILCRQVIAAIDSGAPVSIEVRDL